MIYCTRDDLRKRNWDAVLKLRDLEEDGQLGPPPPAAASSPEHRGGWEDLEQVHLALDTQHDGVVDRRRKSTAKLADLEPVLNEGLRAGAERQAQRLGVREHVIDASQNVAATMLVQQGEAADRTRVMSKPGATRGRGRSRGLLLHQGPPQGQVAGTSNLGPGRTVLHRSNAHNSGARVIA